MLICGWNGAGADAGADEHSESCCCWHWSRCDRLDYARMWRCSIHSPYCGSSWTMVPLAPVAAFGFGVN